MRVSQLVAGVCHKLYLSDMAIRYGAAWGLLHDIATWPLSHTGEAAFAEPLGTSGGRLRRMMITGSDLLPRWLSARAVLEELEVNPEVLLALFDKRETSLGGDLAVLHTILHSPVTPDSLEGMGRSARAYGLRGFPKASSVLYSFEKDFFCGARLSEEASEAAFMFWRKKRNLYADLINSNRAIEFESSWSRTLRDKFRNLELVDSLVINERDVIDPIAECGTLSTPEIVRYKAPLRYEIEGGKRKAKGGVAVSELQRWLTKRPL